jgi:hypothetical protein
VPTEHPTSLAMARIVLRRRGQSVRESGVLELSSTKRVVHYSMSAPVSPETIG